MSHIQPSNPVDSQGGDCTDPETHSVRVLVTGGGSGGGGGGGAITIADGADAALGSTTDPAKTTDIPGTVISFLRGLVKIFSSAWDATVGRLMVGVTYTEQTFTHTYTAPADDTFELDVSFYNTLCLTWGAGTTNMDGTVFVFGSNDGGASWSQSPLSVSATAVDSNRSQMPGFFWWVTSPSYANVAGLNRVQFRSTGFSFGVGVLSVRGTTAPMWQPTQGVYLMDRGNGSLAIVEDGRLNVFVKNEVQTSKTAWLRPVAPHTATVTTADNEIIPARSRAGCIISNLSASETVFLAPNPNDATNAAVLDSGIALFPGDRWEMSEHTLTLGPVRAIARGTAVVAYQEFDATSP